MSLKENCYDACLNNYPHNVKKMLPHMENFDGEIAYEVGKHGYVKIAEAILEYFPNQSSGIFRGAFERSQIGILQMLIRKGATCNWNLGLILACSHPTPSISIIKLVLEQNVNLYSLERCIEKALTMKNETLRTFLSNIYLSRISVYA